MLQMGEDPMEPLVMKAAQTTARKSANQCFVSSFIDMMPCIAYLTAMHQSWSTCVLPKCCTAVVISSGAAEYPQGMDGQGWTTTVGDFVSYNYFLNKLEDLNEPQRSPDSSNPRDCGD